MEIFDFKVKGCVKSYCKRVLRKSLLLVCKEVLEYFRINKNPGRTEFMKYYLCIL